MSQTVSAPERAFLSLNVERPRAALRSLLPWLVLGFFGLLVMATSLMWWIWTTDALRSIGMYFPIISIVLILRVWRKLGWEADGTWWGVLPLFLAVVLGRSGGNSLQALAFFPGQGIELLPLGLTVFLYGSGMVLLLGGTQLWRKALFPLLLLLLVNPVPTAFARVDIPLQYASARTAHAFALAIGVHPDVNQLRLMFAPNFGMFIAPGCDGIRGAVTLGYLALIVGYLYQFSYRFRALLVVGAVALGYLFNLLRLCALVLFYRVALTFPSLQPHGEGADYLIGGLLFLCAVVLFALVVRRKNRPPAGPEITESAPAGNQSVTGQGKWGHGAVVWKGALVAILALLSAIPNLRDLVSRVSGETSDASGRLAASLLPEQVGQYRLLRTWQEHDVLNHVLYRWGAYATGTTASEIDIGFWFGPGVHYPIGCHLARGDRPAWQQTQTLPTANGGTATFELDFYDEEKTRILEAATVCDQGGCNQSVVLPQRVGLVFAGMDLKDLVLRPTSSPMPIVIRSQSNDLALYPPAARIEMLQQLRDFVASANSNDWVHFAESRD
jgi:exosortase J